MPSPQIGERGAGVLNAGLAWAVTVGLLAFLGHLLDGWIGTRPLFLVVGGLLGAVGGFMHFLAKVAPEMLPFGRRKRPASPPPPPDPGSRKPE